MLLRKPSTEDIVPPDCDRLLKFWRMGRVRLNFYNLRAAPGLFKFEVLRVLRKAPEGEDQEYETIFNEEELLVISDLCRQGYEWLRDNRPQIISELRGPARGGR